MRFFVLGPIEVETAVGERHLIGSANQRAILAMLLCRSGAVVATDELIEGLWGDDPPPSAVKTLRTYVSRLRRLVGDRLVGHDDGYSLDCAGAEVDARIFEREVNEGRFSDALERWRGRPYGDAADLPTVRGDAVRLESLLTAARAGQLDELLAEGRLAEAISGAEAFVIEDPVNEAGWATLVRALARSGRVTDALRAFQRAASELAEAGLEPSSVLRAAESEALSDPPAVSTRRHVPSRPLTETVGVQAEIDELVALTAARRLVTIVGPGGVGKTRLSIEVGRAAAERHALGTRVVELSRIGDPVALGPTIRRALDLAEEDSELVLGLGAVDALLVLDNCEHLIDAVAAEVPTLLAGGDRLHVLATSREPLGVAGEKRHPLAPLSTAGRHSPALTLFIERAGDVGITVDPADELASAVVARLDGLPLAIEMAAARLATMSLGDLAEELEQTVATLGGNRRGVDERHSTLRAVLAWSEALLTPEQRSALADLSIFAGPVSVGDLPAAIQAGDPVELVSALAERSLVTVDLSAGSRARYGVLETVRRFARERLEAEGRLDAVGRRHAEWFTDAAEAAAVDFDSPAQGDAVVRIDAMFDELRAAHRWARIHDPTLAVRLSLALFQPAFQGLRLEVFDWSLTLAAALSPGTEGAGQLFAELSQGLTLLGRMDDARAWADRAIAESPDPAACRAAYGSLADIALYTGDLEGSLRSARRYDELVEEVGSKIERVMTRASLALPLAYLGRHDEALSVIPTKPPLDAPPVAWAWLAYSRGEVLLDVDPQAALHELDTAVALAEPVNCHFITGVAQVSAASLRVRSGHAEESIRPMARTIERLTDRGNATHLLTTLRNLPTLLGRLGDWQGAAEVLGGIASASISPTYGEEADRLAAAEREARSALGERGFVRAYREGTGRSLDQTARTAVVLLDRLGGAAPA